MKGRGITYNPKNQFLKDETIMEDEFLEHCRLINENPESNKTEIIEVFPKTIINKVPSPDVGMDYSVNPYQGCEHGCAYCYARNSHEYWGYSAGTDFEKKVLVKKNAPDLLVKEISKRSYEPKMIMFSGNTDCYQPIESKLEITRELLKICLASKHPVGIITKNHLILRDLDILKELNKHNLLRVTISVTSLNETTRRLMEPRTSSVKNRLKTIEKLSNEGIRVNVNMAPIIPWINDQEIFELVKTVADHGAVSAMYILVRLSGHLSGVFSHWLEENYPDRKEKVLNAIRECRNGKLNDTRFGVRMVGEGPRANYIKRTFKLACNRYLPENKHPDLNFRDFNPISDRQLNLF